MTSNQAARYAMTLAALGGLGDISFRERARYRKYGPPRAAGNEAEALPPDQPASGLRRNEKCRCGSGKKFKACCLKGKRKESEAHGEEPK